MKNEIQSGKIAEAMRELSDEQRDVLIYVSIKGFSYRDAAALLGKSEQDTKDLLSEARATLQSLLDNPVPVKRKKNFMNPCIMDFTPPMLMAA